MRGEHLSAWKPRCRGLVERRGPRHAPASGAGARIRSRVCGALSVHSGSAHLLRARQSARSFERARQLRRPAGEPVGRSRRGRCHAPHRSPGAPAARDSAARRPERLPADPGSRMAHRAPVLRPARKSRLLRAAADARPVRGAPRPGMAASHDPGHGLGRIGHRELLRRARRGRRRPAPGLRADLQHRASGAATVHGVHRAASGGRERGSSLARANRGAEGSAQPVPNRRDVAYRDIDVFVWGHSHAPSSTVLEREADTAIAANTGCCSTSAAGPGAPPGAADLRVALRVDARPGQARRWRTPDGALGACPPGTPTSPVARAPRDPRATPHPRHARRSATRRSASMSGGVTRSSGRTR